MNISVGGVIDIQTAIASSCDSEIYCTLYNEETTGVISIKHSRDNYD